MTEAVPEFGVFRPLTAKSARALGEVATFTAGQITKYCKGRGLERPVAALPDHGVTIASPRVLSEYFAGAPGQFNFGTFVERLHADVLPEQRTVWVLADTLTVASNESSKGLVLSLGRKGAGSLLRKQRYIVNGAFEEAGATIPAVREDNILSIGYIDMGSGSDYAPLPPDARADIRSMAAQILAVARRGLLQFDPLVVGPNMRTPLPETLSAES